MKRILSGIFILIIIVALTGILVSAASREYKLPAFSFTTTYNTPTLYSTYPKFGFSYTNMQCTVTEARFVTQYQYMNWLGIWINIGNTVDFPCNKIYSLSNYQSIITSPATMRAHLEAYNNYLYSGERAPLQSGDEKFILVNKDY